MESRTNVISRQWRQGKVRPLQGNPPHDRPVSRGLFSLKENLRRSLRCHWLPALTEILRRLSMRFLRHGGIYRSDVVKAKTKPWGGTVPPPAGRPRAQVKERDGRTTLFSSSAMSSGRLFLDRVARQQSPSPLHRHEQINTHSAESQAKGDISTLPGGGHFYFALTRFSVPIDTAFPAKYNRHLIYKEGGHRHGNLRTAS